MLYFSVWHVQLFCLISTSVIPAMRETKEALENVSVSLVVLQEGTGKLSSDLSQVRSSINRTLSDPDCYDEESDATTVQLCHSIRQSLPQLQIGANFTRVKTDCNILHLITSSKLPREELSVSFLEKGICIFIPTPCDNRFIDFWKNLFNEIYFYVTWQISEKQRGDAEMYCVFFSCPT